MGAPEHGKMQTRDGLRMELGQNILSLSSTAQNQIKYDRECMKKHQVCG